MNAIIKQNQKLVYQLKKHTLIIVLILLYLFMAIFAPHFFTVDNHLNILRNVAITGIIAFGMTMVIISGEIDLSVGSGVAFAGTVTALLIEYLTNFSGSGEGYLVVLISCIITVVIMSLIACINGLFRQFFSVPTFITTLALLLALRGIANLLTNGFPVLSLPEWFSFIGNGFFLGIPFPVYIFGLAFAATYFLMNHTTFGRSVYAVGGNIDAAHLSGINVWRVKIMALVITSIFTAFAGIMISSRIMAGNPTTAVTLEFDVISAVIIGGTSLFGGRGSIGGTFVGLIFLGVIVNGMTLLNISEYWQNVVRAILILLAVLLTSFTENSNAKNDI